MKHTGEHCQHIQDMALEEKMEESGAGRGASLGAGGGVRPLYIVTPTYTRATQLADLTRLANTLRLVRGVGVGGGGGVEWCGVILVVVWSGVV